MEDNYFLIETECKIQKIYLSEILYISIDSGITYFQLLNIQVGCNKSLKELSECLPDYFVRINRFCTINIFTVIEFIKKDRILILSNKERLIVSYRNVKNVINILRIHSINVYS